MDRRKLLRYAATAAATFSSTLALQACSSGTETQPVVEQAKLGLEQEGLAQAYSNFKARFEADNKDELFEVGFASSDLLDTESIRPQGKAIFDFVTEQVTATVKGLSATDSVELWMVKNVPGPGRSARPEPNDTFVLIGSFTDNGDGTQSLSTSLGADIRFDFDLLVLSRSSAGPDQSVLASGFRTLFEKRYFREKFGLSAPSVGASVNPGVETTDELVLRGADIFFNETFAGNSRTCGTCHRAENNLTIDPAFIATLPDTDPLFVAENNPALAALENPQLLRQHGLILENIDGFDDPENKFVMRSVQHTFALSTTLDPSPFPGFQDIRPPDQRTGWSGDGAPGRGTLQEFALGAVAQHFPLRLDRVPGTDFRIPTQEELDALEAFQLFTGRQHQPDLNPQVFRDARVQNGKTLFEGRARCFVCHTDASAESSNFRNLSFDTGVEMRPLAAQLNLPPDQGFGAEPSPTVPGGFGDGTFNVQPLIEAADTAPFFHNNSAATLEEAITHYTTDLFDNSPAVQQNGGLAGIELTPQELGDLAAFLRVINAAENIRQVRKRLEFVRDVRGAGNTEILRIAEADTQDALDVLNEQSLHPTARHHLAVALQTIVMAKAHPDAYRPAYIDWALLALASAKDDLFAPGSGTGF